VKRRNPGPFTTPLPLGGIRPQAALRQWPAPALVRANTPEAWDALMRDLDAGFTGARHYRR